jgi:hypothetical protein
MKKEILLLLTVLAVIITIQFSSSAKDHCYPMWNCTSWSNCMNNMQIRTCYDFNACENNSRRPNETQICGAICNSNWQCTEWVPNSCTETKQQNRTCTDTNNCQTLKGIPEEFQSCNYQPNYFWMFPFITIVLGIIILGIFWSLVRRFVKKKESSPLSL